MKLPWKTIGLCVWLATITVVFLCRPAAKEDSPRPAAVVTSDTGPTIERIVALSSLTTLKVDVADVVESELQGRTGKIRAVVVVKGSVALGVDLAKAKFDAVDQEHRRAVLVLPPPTLQYVKLDHEHTKIVGLWSSGLWVIVPGGGDADAVAVDRGYREAERLVGDVAHDVALVQRCRAQTEEVLRSFLGALGWTVEVKWREIATS